MKEKKIEKTEKNYLYASKVNIVIDGKVYKSKDGKITLPKKVEIKRVKFIKEV